AGKVITALRKIGEQLFGLAVESSKLEGISAQFASLTQNLEGGLQAMLRAMQDASGGMITARDLMSKFNSATSLVSQDFAQTLPRALGILTKASFATGKSVEFLFDKFQRGVARASPLLLDDLEIQVPLAEATAFAAEMFGKEAEALNEVEKGAAIAELTLTKLEDAFGALPDTTQTLTAGVARLQTNFKNIGDTLGTFLIPAFTTVVDAVNRVVEAFALAIGEGEQLEPLLITIGAGLSLAADAFAKFADFVIKTFTGISFEVSSNVAQMAEDALRWGVELIAAFAEGIVSAATTVLTQAMQFIGDILSSWLLGASPPKVAPGIVGWGINLMQMFLEGMTKADFGILGEIQGPLKKILEGPEFANVSKVLAGALAGDDRGAFLEATGRAAGVFGDAVRKLAELNFELADSIEDVQAAEAALAQSREQVTDSQAEVNRLTAEYNRLLRESAGPKTLQAQLGLINAAEGSLQVARDQVNAQEDAIKTAKERQKQLGTEKDLQKSVVDQLLSVNDALNQQEKDREKAAKSTSARKAKGVAPISEALTEGFAPVGLGGRIGGAIDKLKEQLKEKFKDIFKPLGEAWQAIKEDIGGLGDVWDKFVVVVGEAWGKIKEKFPFIQEVEDWVNRLLSPEGLQKLADFFTVTLWGAMKDVWEWVKVTFEPLWTSLGGLFTSLLGASFRKFMTWWDELLAAISEVDRFMREEFLPWWEKKGAPFFAEFISGLESGLAGVQSMIETVAGWIDSLARAIDNLDVSKLWPFVGFSPSPLAVGLKSINDELAIMSNMRMPALGQLTPSMQGAFSSSMPMMGSMSSPNITVNAGGNTINSGMDEAAFDARLERGLRRVLSR
ncbi:MAG: hypothetical protein ACW99U_20075, partial [Candidatus Thorarchaeota archaeon]